MFASHVRKVMSKAVGAAAIGSAGYLGWTMWENSKAVCEALAMEVDTSKAPKPTKSISGIRKDDQDFHVTLYQYQTCPFCSKVRAYFDYYGLSYDVVEVNPLFRKEVKFSTYKKVPFVLYNDQKDLQKQELLLPDSSLIVSLLQTVLIRSKSDKTSVKDLLKYYPESETVVNGKPKPDYANKYFIMFETEPGAEKSNKIRLETKWRKWVDDSLVHTLSPNIYQSPSEAVRTFKYLSEAGDWEHVFPAWQIPVVIYVGATAMYAIGKRLKKRYNLKDDVRVSLYEACDEWVKAVGNKQFLGGSEPNLADLATYGVLNAIEGCDAFADLSRNTAILPWYERMKTAVTNHEGAKSLLSSSSTALY